MYKRQTLNRSKCKVTGADFVSAKALDDSSLQVKADYRPVTVLGDTQQAGWSSTSKKKAVWKSVEYAPGYTCLLYTSSAKPPSFGCPWASSMLSREGMALSLK